MKKIRLGLLGKITLLTGGLTILTIATSRTVNLSIVHKNQKDDYIDSCVRATEVIQSDFCVLADDQDRFTNILNTFLPSYESVIATYDSLTKEEKKAYQDDISQAVFGSKTGMGLSAEQGYRKSFFADLISDMRSSCYAFTVPVSKVVLYDIARERTIDFGMNSSGLQTTDDAIRYSLDIFALSEKVTFSTELNFYKKNLDSIKYIFDDTVFAIKHLESQFTVIDDYRVYVIGEYSLAEFNSAFNRQLTTELLITIGSGLFLVLVYILFAKLFLLRNFKKLSDSTTQFVDKMNNNEPLEIIDSNIKSKDEVKDLSNKFLSMQHSIINYVDNIKAAQDKERQFNTEVEIASNIQLDSLPAPMYFDKNVELRAFIKTAKGVGGDFYDYFYIDKDHLAVMIADVSGKGIPASLFMMRAKERIKAACSTEKTLSDALFRVNNSLFINNKEGFFVTAFVGVLNLKTYEFNFISAGHERPFIKHNGKCERLKVESNFVLGLEEDFNYKSQKIKLAEGDTVILYTDGLNEAINKDKEEFGYDRIQESLLKDNEVRENIKTLVSDLEAFTGEEEQFDDITLIGFKIKKDVVSFEYLTPTYADIDDLTDKISACLEDLDVAVVSKIGIIIDEVMNNIISYGKTKTNKFLVASVEKTEGGANLVFVDNSHPFNPLLKEKRTAQENLDAGIVGGLGISIVKSITKETTRVGQVI